MNALHKCGLMLFGQSKLSNLIHSILYHVEVSRAQCRPWSIYKICPLLAVVSTGERNTLIFIDEVVQLGSCLIVVLLQFIHCYRRQVVSVHQNANVHGYHLR